MGVENANILGLSVEVTEKVDRLFSVPYGDRCARCGLARAARRRYCNPCRAEVQREQRAMRSQAVQGGDLKLRFVVLATLSRGVVAPGEALDADQQAAAFAAWERDEPQRFDAREPPAAEVDCAVEWARSYKPEPVVYEQPGRVEKLMRLARVRDGRSVAVVA